MGALLSFGYDVIGFIVITKKNCIPLKSCNTYLQNTEILTWSIRAFLKAPCADLHSYSRPIYACGCLPISVGCDVPDATAIQYRPTLSSDYYWQSKNVIALADLPGDLTICLGIGELITGCDKDPSRPTVSPVVFSDTSLQRELLKSEDIFLASYLIIVIIVWF